MVIKHLTNYAESQMFLINLINDITSTKKSAAQLYAPIQLRDVFANAILSKFPNGYSKSRAYIQSTSANVCIAVSLN